MKIHFCSVYSVIQVKRARWLLKILICTVVYYSKVPKYIRVKKNKGNGNCCFRVALPKPRKNPNK